MDPIEWVVLLAGRLHARAARIGLYDAYFRGDHPLVFATDRFQQAFGGRFEAFADNWCGLVVETLLERLTVVGFRAGGASEDANRLWHSNQLAARSQLALKEALIHGAAYLSVGQPDEGAPVRIAAEHPAQVICAHNPGDPQQIDAALKLWTDDDGDHATLYLPDETRRYTKRRSVSSGLIVIPAGVRLPTYQWELRDDGDVAAVTDNPLGIVPVVPLIDRPRLLDPASETGPIHPRRGAPANTFIGDGESELAEIVPLQDALNKTLMDALVASEFVGYPQRWMLNWEPERDAHGKPKLPFDPGSDRIWWIKPTKQNQPEPQFGQFDAADLNGYVHLVEMVLQHVASITRTPPHYLGQISGQLPSGESLKSAEAGLVAKALDRQLFFGDGFEQAVRLGLLLGGRTDVDEVETLWKDPESRTESEHIDAVVKQRALGIADELLQERAGWTPAEIERNRTLIREQRRMEAAALFAGDRDALDAALPGDPDDERPAA